MRRLMIAGNWKMNQKLADVAGYFQELGSQAEQSRGLDVLIATPFLHLSAAQQVTAGGSVHVAAQNCHAAESGAYTGETSLAMLEEVGVRWTLVGHSERRQLFAETDQTVHQKVAAGLQRGFGVIACVGETLEERDGGQVEAVLARQVEAIATAYVNSGELLIAYEPVWAIGTGRTATPEQAQQAHAFIRAQWQKHVGADAAAQLRILYGGSVKPENTFDLMGQADIDGALVGGASLKAESFCKIITEAGRHESA